MRVQLFLFSSLHFKECQFDFCLMYTQMPVLSLDSWSMDIFPVSISQPHSAVKTDIRSALICLNRSLWHSVLIGQKKEMVKNHFTVISFKVTVQPISNVLLNNYYSSPCLHAVYIKLRPHDSHFGGGGYLCLCVPIKVSTECTLNPSMITSHTGISFFLVHVISYPHAVLF